MIPITDRVVDQAVLDKAVAHFRSLGIILPTFAEQRDPELIPGRIKDKLRKIGLWDLHPLNLFRITWKNEPKEKGGLFGGVNFLELPQALTGVQARVVLLIGKWFPTGAHKVGAAYGCLVPRLVSGQFDPTFHKAVWPSTGNYCRGGAFDSYLMGCTSVAILPEGMSRERFDWLKEIGAEVIATPGSESNVKEIYDKCWEIRKTRPDCVIFNQFDEFGNPCWHYFNTGAAVEDGRTRLYLGGLRLLYRFSRHHRRRRLSARPVPLTKSGGGRGAAVPDPVAERLRRPPHRGHRRQACALGAQRPQYRRRGRHR
jgi:cysteine synthase A